MTFREITNQLLVSNDYLFRLALSLTKNSDDAFDLLQDTRYKVLSKWKQFKEGTNFQAWVHTIMKNLFINNYRKKKKRESYLQLQSKMPQKYMSSSMLDYPLVEEKVFGEIDRLNPHLKQVIELHMGGYKYDEIADKLDLPLGTVKSRIFQTRKKLRTRLEALELM